MGATSRWPSIAIASIGAVTYLACCSRWLDRSYDYDESLSVDRFISQESFFRSFIEQQVFNNHLLVSMANWIVWHLGGTTEPWQRLFPMVAGAACVALIAVWVARRFGLLAAAASTVLVAVNPMFVELGTQVRGYASAALFVTIATLVLDGWLRGGQFRRRIYVAAVSLALLSHLYVVVVLVAHGVGALRARRGEFEDWFRTSLLAGAVAGIVYLPTAGTMFLASTSRPSRFMESFPAEAAEAYGRFLVVTVLILGLASASIFASDRREVRWMALSSLAALAAIWLIIRPHDLYPRFLVWMVPLVAVAIGASVRRWPATALGAVVLFALWAPSAASPGPQPPVRAQAAAYRSLAADHRACTYGYFAESLGAYLDGQVRAFESGVACDVVLFRGRDVDRLPAHFVVIGGLEQSPATCVTATANVKVDVPLTACHR